MLFTMSSALIDSLEHCSDSDQGHEGDWLSLQTKENLWENEMTDSTKSDTQYSGRFVISTIKLKDSPDCQTKFSNTVSKSVSTESNSSCGSQSFTFLCNEFVTHLILMFLKDSVLEANAEAYKLVGQADLKCQENDKQYEKVDYPSWSKSDPCISISKSELTERTSRLLQSVSEALWRYDVVKSSIFYDSSSLQTKNQHLSQFQSSISSSEGTDKEGKKHRKKKKKHRRTSFSGRKESFAESSIIQCMLSSPTALLRYSLWSQNLKQAKQVIKFFRLDHTSEAKEVEFLQELQKISQKLFESEKSNTKSFHMPFSRSHSDSEVLSNLQAIEEVAVSGMQSSELCLLVNQELSGLKIPSIEDITGGVKHPELLLCAKNVYSVFLVDLGYNSDISSNMFSILSNMASRSWKNPDRPADDFHSSSFGKKKTPVVRGILKTLDMMNSSMKESSPLCGSEGAIKLLFWPLNVQCLSFSHLLSNFVGNLDSGRFKEEVRNWTQCESLMKDLVLLLKKENDEKCGNSQNDVAQENKLHMTYKKLSKVLRDLQDCSSELIRPQPVHYVNYLSKLLIHLHQVSTAILDCKKQKINTGISIHTSDFSIIKESPVELLKKIILQSSVTPDKIEKFAVRMKVNLLHVLAQACLPHVPLLSKNISSENVMHSLSPSNNFQGYPLLLNKSKSTWPQPRHPDLVARELVKDLISMIQDTVIVNDSCGIFNFDELHSLAKHSEVQSWMEDCSELAFVDLRLLKSREEKVAFFVNVSNIAYLHAVLLEIISWNSEDSLLLHSSTGTLDQPRLQLLSPLLLERLIMQKVLGYSIGQLGAVSIFDLRHQILHAQLPLPKHLQDPPFYNLIGDHNSSWEKFLPPVEPKLLFVLVEGLLYSPKLQVVYSEHLDERLDEAIKDYLDFHITVNLEENSVSLPHLLLCYANDFSKEDDAAAVPFQGLLTYITKHVRSNLQHSLQNILSERDLTSSGNNNPHVERSPCLQFKSASSAFCLLLQYSSDDFAQTHSSTIKSLPITEIQPSILDHLNEKCSILYDLYEIFRGTCSASIVDTSKSFLQKLLNGDLCWNDKDQPLMQMLSYYKNLNAPCNDMLSWFSSALSMSPMRSFISNQIQTCFITKQWEWALHYADVYLEIYERDYSYRLLRQTILEHLASVDSMKSFIYALCIDDPMYRSNAVLHNVNKWSDSSAIEALKFCLSDSDIVNYPDVEKLVSHKLQEVQLYKNIFDASEMCEDSDARDCVYVFNNWQEVADCSIWEQSRVLGFIKSCEKYELSVQWTELHVVNKEQKMLALSMNIIWHLSQTPMQLQLMHQILDLLEDPSECITLCNKVLLELSTVEAKLCLVQYIVDNNCSPENQHYYINMMFGLKMLAAIKPSSRENYIDLIAHPYLLLEQMLMNVELRDAEEALNAILEDLKLQTDIVPVININSVNQLVEDYASKALEVHFLDALLDVSSSSTLVLSTEEVLASDDPYIMPLRVPTKDEWVPDAKIHRCQVCKEERFNMFSRRHHCRRCGRVVCSNCSQHALIVEGYGNLKVRVCDDCYNLMTGSLSLTTASYEKRYRLLSSMRSPSPRNSPIVQSDGSVFRRRTSSLCGHPQSLDWVLSADSEQNASVRNEFSYDLTPSISLCYSILKLHSDNARCAQFMVNLCDRLLGKIKSKYTGKLLLEVDYSLIISMMKSLLMNAKMKFHQAMNFEGVGLADLYNRHLDIIKLLANANCYHLIPREVTNKDNVRKLRDKLLQEERMNLALEVSTKYNLETGGVWSSWGLVCLKAGDWITARTKFQQFLKVLNDKNDQSHESPLLNKILAVLEGSKHPGTGKAATIHKILLQLNNITNGSNQIETDVPSLHILARQECLFYLNLYGTHLTTVEFFQKHNLLLEALEYISEKKCNTDVFNEGLFMPCLKNAQLSSLKHLIMTNDPMLNVWSQYLLAACRYLERLKYSNVLYEIQVFMEDYARAATSAINFYLKVATSYRVLFDYNCHLHNAKKHYEKYLLKIKDSSDSWTKKRHTKIIPIREAESYIQVIKLQEEVTNFLKECRSHSKDGSFYEVEHIYKAKASSISTLFGNSEVKSEVATMVLVNSVHVDKGFELARNIIKAFSLDGTTIASTAGKELVRIRQRLQIPHFLTSLRCVFKDLVKVDEIILDCIAAVNDQGGDVEDIIKMLTSDSNKINAYLTCSKLKSAYLLAIKLNSALDVRRVMVAAKQCGQDSIERFCTKWLETNSMKLKPKEPSPL